MSAADALMLILEAERLRRSHRHVLSGSYNNYFHIYDKNAETDVVLQADKSAFKAKKTAGGKNNANKPAGGKGANGAGKKLVETENIDYQKKILYVYLLSYASTMLTWVLLQSRKLASAGERRSYRSYQQSFRASSRNCLEVPISDISADLLWRTREPSNQHSIDLSRIASCSRGLQVLEELAGSFCYLFSSSGGQRVVVLLLFPLPFISLYQRANVK